LNLEGDLLYDSEGSTSGILTLGTGPQETFQIVYEAVDDAGNKLAHTVELVIKDKEEPADISECPEDAVYIVEEHETGHEHTWTVPRITKDNCLETNPMGYPAAVETHKIEPGHHFPFGTALVSYVLEDPAGNAYEKGCDFSVTVKQKIVDPPWLKCPTDINIQTIENADFGILPHLNGEARQNKVDLPITYDHGVNAGMPFHFGVTHVVARTESASHLATCSFKVTVGDIQRPKVDGRQYRCENVDSELAEPYGVCEGPKLDISKDPAYRDTHKYTITGTVNVATGCCNDAHGTKYECVYGGGDWTSKYCMPAQ